MMIRRVLASLALASFVCLAGSCRDAKAPTAPTGASIAAGDAQTGAVGARLAKPLVVQVFGAGGVAVSGQAITFTVTSGGGSVSVTTTTTDATGTATTQWTLGTSVADSQVVQASMGADTASAPTVIGTFHARPVPGPAQIAAVSGGGQSAASNATLPDSLLVRVADQYGNPIAQDTVKWTTNFGSLLPAWGVSDAQGYVSTHWTVGAAGGLETATATAGSLTSVVFTATVTYVPPPITLTVKAPAANGFVADTMQVSVTATSTYQVSTITAAIGTRQAALSYSQAQQAWVGQVVLTGLPFGATQLLVTATDVQSNSVSKSLAVRYDDPPQLTVTSPTAYSVATPTLHIQATCVSKTAAGCAEVTASITSHAGAFAPIVLASGVSGLDATVSLASYAGNTLTIAAVDAAGQDAAQDFYLPVASIQNMTLMAAEPGTVTDVSGSQVLYVDSTNGRALMKIHDATSPDVTVLDQANTIVWGSRLTPLGALYLTTPSARFPFSGVQDFRNGTTTNLGLTPGGDFVHVNGSYALWESGAGNGVMTLRDLVAGTNTTLSNSAGNTEYDVTANGDAAFWSSTYQIFFAPHQDTALQITHDTTLWNVYPVTDGTSIVYTKLTPCCANQTYQITMWSSSTGEVALAAPRTGGVDSGHDYRINNGWIAYTDLNGGQLQVWSYSPTRTKQQVTFLGTSSSIEGLGANGEVVYSNGGQRYLSKPPYATAVPLGSTLGTMLWRDGHFVLLIAGSVYQVN